MGKISKILPSLPNVFIRINFKPNTINVIDCFIIFALTFFSLLIKFWKFGFPNYAIYDEATFGHFATFHFKPYFTNTIKPNLNQLIFGSILYLAHYKNNINWDKDIGSQYSNEDDYYVFFRLIIISISSLTTPLIYISARILNLSHCPSLMASLFICLDISSIITSKFILPDSLNQFFACLHLFSMCLLLVYKSHFCAFLVGSTLIMAISCKFSFISILIFDLVICFFHFSFSRAIFFIIEISLSAYCVFNMIFVIQFLFIQPDNFNMSLLMKYEYQLIIKSIRSIILKISNIFEFNLVQLQRFQKPIISFLDLINTKLLSYQKLLSENSQTINRRHNHGLYDTSLYTRRHGLFNNYNSDPILWPFLFEEAITLYSMPTPDLYDSKYKTKDDHSTSIRLIGSPASYWLSTFGLFLTFVFIPFNILDFRNLVFIFGWMSTYFPFLFDSKFFYMTNYLVPLIFSSLNLATLIDNIGKKSFLRKQIAALLAMSNILLGFLCFIYFYPWIMGTPCHECETNLLWLKRWKEYSYKPIDFSGFRAYNMTKVMRDDFPAFQ